MIEIHFFRSTRNIIKAKTDHPDWDCRIGTVYNNVGLRADKIYLHGTLFKAAVISRATGLEIMGMEVIQTHDYE